MELAQEAVKGDFTMFKNEKENKRHSNEGSYDKVKINYREWDDDKSGIDLTALTMIRKG